MTNPTITWNNLLIDTFDDGLMLSYILKWHLICDLWSGSFFTFLQLLGKATQDSLESGRYPAASQTEIASSWCHNLGFTPHWDPKFNLSNWVSPQIIIIKHVENTTAAFHSPLLYQACTQTSEMGDQMDFGVLISYVRNTIRQLKFSSATTKILKKRLNCRQLECDQASLSVWTCCYEREVLWCSFLL